MKKTMQVLVLSLIVVMILIIACTGCSNTSSGLSGAPGDGSDIGIEENETFNKITTDWLPFGR